FTKLEKPGSVDDVMKFIVQDLQTPIPLSMLLLASIKEELEKRATEVDFVERTTIAGNPVDHLAVRTGYVDFQVWVAQGEQPLPLRVVITYKSAPGQPQFSADLSDWNLAPKIEESAFAFSPPAGAQAIAVVVAAVAVAVAAVVAVAVAAEALAVAAEEEVVASPAAVAGAASPAAVLL